MHCPASPLLLTAQNCSCGSYSYHPVPALQLFSHQLAHLGWNKQIKSSGFFLVLAYISSEYVLVFFGWELLLQLLGSPSHCNTHMLKSWSGPGYSVPNGISFGPVAILLTFPFGVAAYILGI